MTPQPLGQRFRAWRIEQGLTQSDVAKRLECSVQHVCDIEKGKRLVHVEHRSPILVKIEKLIGWEPTDWQASASALDAENARLATEVKRLQRALAEESDFADYWSETAQQCSDIIQSLRCELDDERRASAWFEAAALALQDELAALRTRNERLRLIIDTYGEEDLTRGMAP